MSMDNPISYTSKKMPPLLPKPTFLNEVQCTSNEAAMMIDNGFGAHFTTVREETMHISLNKDPYSISPSEGSPNDWFEKSARAAIRVNFKLSQILQLLYRARVDTDSVQKDEEAYNKLQQALNSSINALLDIRKNLWPQFSEGIKTITFPSQEEENTNDNEVEIVSSTTSEKKLENPERRSPQVQNAPILNKILQPAAIETTSLNSSKRKTDSKTTVTCENNENDDVEDSKDDSGIEMSRNGRRNKEKRKEKYSRAAEVEINDNISDEDHRSLKLALSTKGTKEWKVVRKKNKRNCFSYNIKDEPSPKIRRMFSARVILKQSPLVERRMMNYLKDLYECG